MNDQHTCRDPAPHRIRLQSVWDPPRSGVQAWRRHFGRPAGIEPGIRVTLVLEEPAVASLLLNGAALPLPATAGSRWTHDVTELLADRNELLLVPATGEEVGARQAANAHGRRPLPLTLGRVFLEILTPSRAEQ
jgi:hypothetical protein